MTSTQWSNLSRHCGKTTSSADRTKDRAFNACSAMSSERARLKSYPLTLGGSVLRSSDVPADLLPTTIPAEAKLRLLGSAMLVRPHLKGERPPLSMIRLDMPVIPLAGFPYLKIRKWGINCMFLRPKKPTIQC